MKMKQKRVACTAALAFCAIAGTQAQTANEFKDVAEQQVAIGIQATPRSALQATSKVASNSWGCQTCAVSSRA